MKITPGQAMLMLIGIVMITIALSADWLGIGDQPGFGPSQIVLATAGFGLSLTGLALRADVVRRWARRFMFSKAALILGGFLVGLLLAECGLRVLEMVEHRQENIGIGDQFIPDPKLGRRVAPHTRGHDANGFRNDRILDQVDIVAIGDSQTWGFNVSRSKAWPQTLEKLSGRSAYNMGFCGYGPVQYWVLTEEALELSPKFIVVGLYFGNDLWDAYQLVYSSDTYTQYRSTRTTSDLLHDTITPRAHDLWDEVAEFHTQFQGRSVWNTWLGGHSAIVRLLYRYGWWPWAADEYEASKVWAQAFPNHGAVYENDGVRTAFTTALRLLGVDLDEPRIAEGLRITKEMLLGIQARTDAAGVKLLVLLIPSKEIVYADVVETGPGHLDETYVRLVHMEARARAGIVSLCEENGIEYVDVLPVLEEAVERNEQIYPQSTEGHPNARGHYLLASAVHDALIRLEQ